MRSLYRILLSAVVFAPVSLVAQVERPLSVDATIGGGPGRGGEYTNRAEIAASPTLVFPHRSSLIGGLTVGGQTPIGMGDVCQIPASGLPHCLPDFPGFTYTAALVGEEFRAGIVVVRGLVGPGIFLGGPVGLGAHANASVAVGITHLALVGELRGSAIRVARGENLQIGSLQFGFRIR